LSFIVDVCVKKKKTKSLSLALPPFFFVLLSTWLARIVKRRRRIYMNLAGKDCEEEEEDIYEPGWQGL